MNACIGKNRGSATPAFPALNPSCPLPPSLLPAARCVRVPCREVSTSELQAVHTESLVRLVEEASLSALMAPDSEVSITSDTYVNQHTNLCARLAAGGACEVACMVARGEAPHGAAIIRPPGHHAESGMAMGFCFFNNAGVAARAAQAEGARRIIILDWDIHHVRAQDRGVLAGVGPQRERGSRDLQRV